MLFSEPKISQYRGSAPVLRERHRFSALQRAENFSICSRHVASTGRRRVSVLFSEPKISQCCAIAASRVSSGVSVLFSEPKISQSGLLMSATMRLCRFSALQRAENFSIVDLPHRARRARWFQCSSASRKFLNPNNKNPSTSIDTRFSALQRAENFSIKRCPRPVSMTECFSALQRAENFSIFVRRI